MWTARGACRTPFRPTRPKWSPSTVNAASSIAAPPSPTISRAPSKIVTAAGWRCTAAAACRHDAATMRTATRLCTADREVLEPGELPDEGELDDAGGPVALFTDDQLGDALRIGWRLALVLVLILA